MTRAFNYIIEDVVTKRGGRETIYKIMKITSTNSGKREIRVDNMNLIGDGQSVG